MFSDHPVTVDALAEALREADQAEATVALAGAGSKAGWGGRGATPDRIVHTTGLTGVVEHARGDLVVTALAGTPLADVQEALAHTGQWLPLDPPEPSATLGGIVATAASGPHRFRFGTPRDLLIGVTVVLADGTVARSGGKVVKNVAGYDLGRLFSGSFGTLGVVASCTFKLQPVAPERRVVSVPADRPGAVATALARSTTTPVAAEWDGDHAHVLVESSPAAADAMAAELAADLGGAVADRVPAGFGARPWREGDVALKLTHRLSALDAVVDTVRAAVPAARLSAHVGSGVVWAAVPADPESAADLVTTLRAQTAAYDGSVVVVDAPVEVKERVDVWGPVRGLDVMRRIKERFDPAGRLNAGRFVGGI
jgi:glycolate oxidase FAD binding subunit